MVKHITERVNKAYSILGIIKRNFQHVDKDAFVFYLSRYIYKAETRTFVTQDLRRRRFSDKSFTPMHINIT